MTEIGVMDFTHDSVSDDAKHQKPKSSMFHLMFLLLNLKNLFLGTFWT